MATIDQTNSVSRKLAEKALKIFLLHYYSLDWTRGFLLHRRFKDIFQLESTRLSSNQLEDDLLLCLNIGIQVFPTARGLKEIENIVCANRPQQVSSNDCRFGVFKTNFCVATRYRMSLFTMAQNAREYHHDTLASLWVIAATAKLDHVSAWQAYAAAKEEESKILNYTVDMEYWKLQKSYVGDISEKKFDEKVMIMQLFQEQKAKEEEFRRYLQLKAKSSVIQHTKILENFDLTSDDFVRIWCNIKANSVGKYEANGLWKLANDLYEKSESSSLIQTIITTALKFEDLIEKFSLLIVKKEDVPWLHQYKIYVKRYAKLITDAKLMLQALTELDGQDLLEINDYPNIQLTIDLLNQSFQKITNGFLLIGNNSKCFEQLLQFASSYDSIFVRVYNLIPILVQHEIHSFPNLRQQIEEVFQRIKNDNEYYLQHTEAITRCYLHLEDPSKEILQSLKKLCKKKKSYSLWILNYENILTAFHQIIENQLPEYNQIKEEIYLKVLYSFAESFHYVHVDKYYACGSWFNSTIQMIFLKNYKEVFSLAMEASTQDNNDSIMADLNVQLLDICLEIITKVNLRNKEISVDIIERLDNFLEIVQTLPSSQSKTLLMLAGRKHKEITNLILRAEKHFKDGSIALSDICLNAVFWHETADYAKSLGDNEWCFTCRGNYLEYVRAIEEFDKGNITRVARLRKQGDSGRTGDLEPSW